MLLNCWLGRGHLIRPTLVLCPGFGLHPLLELKKYRPVSCKSSTKARLVGFMAEIQFVLTPWDQNTEDQSSLWLKIHDIGSKLIWVQIQKDKKWTVHSVTNINSTRWKTWTTDDLSIYLVSAIHSFKTIQHSEPKILVLNPFYLFSAFNLNKLRSYVD